MIDSIRSGTILREARYGGHDTRRADLLDAASKADVDAIDRAEVPTIDVDDAVAALSRRADAVDAAARRADAATAAETAADLAEVLDELSSS